MSDPVYMGRASNANMSDYRVRFTFASAPDYENPQDANGDNTYEVTVTVSDGTFTRSSSLTYPVWDAYTPDPPSETDEAPSITEITSVSIHETVDGIRMVDLNNSGNSPYDEAVIVVIAEDANKDSLTFSLSGTDASSLSINNSGFITFNSTTDYGVKI